MIDTWKRLFLIACLAIIISISFWAGQGFVSISSGYVECILDARDNGEQGAQTHSANTTDTSKIIVNTTYIRKTTADRASIKEPLYIKDVNLRDGRLGNQMFRYASLLGIAETQGRILVVSPGSELEKTFKLKHVDRNGTSKKWSVIHETNALSFDQRLMHLSPSDFQINGFLQSFKYFVAIADELRYEYTFHDHINFQAAAILHDIHAKYRGSLLVGVHVRRGDFTKDYNQRMGYGVPEKSYFTKAFNFMKEKFPGRNITFLIASDDLPWCSTNLVQDGVLVVANASPEVHLAVLAGCDHVIISGGTYGWWSAWLSGGHVVYFTGYLAKNTTFGDKLNRADYYPQYWTGLGN